MEPVMHLPHIADISRLIQNKTRHPLVAVVDFSNIDDQIDAGLRISCGFYMIMFKNYSCNTVRYGRKTYDFQDGSLVCLAPEQLLTMDTEVEQRPDRLGWGLFFHPDLIRGTSLSNKMKDYTFFAYETNEALHLSDKEKQVLHEIVQKIDAELAENIDRHSQTLIVCNIELLLNYCSRYYDRQFITRKTANNDVLAKVERALTNYFQTERPLPTVKQLADEVHLSPDYLSDLLKRETGKSAQDHIHHHLIEKAKDLLLNSNKSVGELAFTLGFDYPQYFSRLFKLKTGLTPLEYRSLN